jgi:DNA polymerase
MARPNRDVFPTAEPFFPPQLSLPTLHGAAAGCKGCDLYIRGTQTVFGQGPSDAAVLFVGEQPGDQEDRAGLPFVGPAGRILDQAMEEAGIDRSTVYVTNAVKHFKWEQRGKRRIHAKPSSRQVNACRPWLIAEIEVVKPRMIVCLGATAAQSLLGPDFRLTQHRGEIIESPHAPWLLATVHPSALLRIPDPAARDAAYAAFVEDLRIVARQLQSQQAETKHRREPTQAASPRPGEQTRRPPASDKTRPASDRPSHRQPRTSHARRPRDEDAGSLFT